MFLKVKLSYVIFSWFNCIWILHRRGNQRRVSVYKTKKKKETDKYQGLTLLKISEEAKGVLQDLFMRYPPDDGEKAKEMVGRTSEKSDKLHRKGDDIFRKPSLSKADIAKKLESLASKMENVAKLREVLMTW